MVAVKAFEVEGLADATSPLKLAIGANNDGPQEQRRQQSSQQRIQSHSSNIVDVLSDLLDKAQTEPDDTRHAELNAVHNFSMLQQFLEHQIAQFNRAFHKGEGRG